ncbi:MAG: hypothetical protein M5U01_39560 [Ardenticatenaceae bacterium]|nr:hypothetical protein [Ardenticatenaceae bacterium]
MADRMKTGVIGILALLGVFVLASCAPQMGLATAPTVTPPPAPTEPPVAAHGGPVNSYTDVVDALRAQGVTVEPAGTLQQPFFPVEAQVIKVNGHDVQVFEFADAAAAEAAAATVSSAGSAVGTTMLNWVEPPHFFRAGPVIVLYVGNDTAVLDALNASLGPQFAGG